MKSMNQRRGLSLVELLMGLAISAMVALGIAGMLGGVANGISVGTDARTGMLATGVIQSRFVEAVTPAACVLAAEPQRTVLWLGDTRPGGLVEPSEMAWLTIDESSGMIRIERVVFPDNWGPIEKAMFDQPIRPNANPFPVLLQVRDQGLAQAEILADGVLRGTFRDSDSLPEVHEVRIDLELDLPTGPRVASVTALLEHHRIPPEWTP